MPNLKIALQGEEALYHKFLPHFQFAPSFAVYIDSEEECGQRKRPRRTVVNKHRPCLPDLVRWSWLERACNGHESIPGDHSQQQRGGLAAECTQESAESAHHAQTPRLLVGQVVAAEEDVSTGDDAQVDTHQEVTGRQVA